MRTTLAWPTPMRMAPDMGTSAVSGDQCAEADGRWPTKPDAGIRVSAAVPGSIMAWPLFEGIRRPAMVLLFLVRAAQRAAARTPRLGHWDVRTVAGHQEDPCAEMQCGWPGPRMAFNWDGSFPPTAHRPPPAAHRQPPAAGLRARESPAGVLPKREVITRKGADWLPW